MELDLGMMAPIQCNEDGPDFTRMAKKSENAADSTDNMKTVTKTKKEQDIRKRFMIEKPRGDA